MLEVGVTYEIITGGKRRKLELERRESYWLCRLDGREMTLRAEPIDSNLLSILRGEESFAVRREPGGKIFVHGRWYEVCLNDRRSWRGRQSREGADEGPQKLAASMPGKVVRVLAREGDEIRANQGIVVIEAMKMQNEIRSPKAGVLRKLRAQAGMNVNAGEVLAIVE
ncbi:MAG: acetyl-CoA carboxylase biotin carboxyl carrier protein subunit [Acidobacteria bacterium]|nr:acetyl-CoA carboxylase biotin carboxyl carrier protein subunit [Acidobacteriota bacterium]